MPRQARIERYDGRDVPHGAIAAIGHSQQTRARRGLSPHSHEVYEICLIHHGVVEWMVDGRTARVGAGSVFLTRPGQVHGSSRGAIEPCSLRWMQIDPGGSSDIARLLEQTGRISRSVWPGDERLAELHEAMMAECRRPQPDSEAMISSLLALFLVTLFRTERQSAATGPMHPAVTKVIGVVERDPEPRWTLDQLQAESGVSRTRLQQLFKRHTGLSPVAYAMRVRLQRAQQLLRQTDKPITRLAQELGFSSSQYFATAFSRQYGMTPTECRRGVGLM